MSLVRVGWRRVWGGVVMVGLRCLGWERGMMVGWGEGGSVEVGG